MRQLTVLDKEGTIASHAGKNRVASIHQAIDVVETRDQNTPLDSADHLSQGCLAGQESDVEPVGTLGGISSRQGIAGGLGLALGGRKSIEHHPTSNSFGYDGHTFLWYA